MIDYLYYYFTNYRQKVSEHSHIMIQYLLEIIRLKNY